MVDSAVIHGTSRTHLFIRIVPYRRLDISYTPVLYTHFSYPFT